jgi:signal peptidase II
MLKWLWLSLGVIVLDQTTKQIAEATLMAYEAVPVLPSFNLTLMYNTGAAFSILADAGGWQRWFFLVLSLAISVVLVIWLSRLEASERYLATALALVLGGALGNFIDRVVFGHVIDFIQVYYDRWYWPAFNIADSAITIGAALLIINSLFGSQRDIPKRTG